MQIEADVEELVKLVSSVTEAYTAAFFLADNQERLLKLWHFYSLSDNVIVNVSIPFGVGPIGRVAESLEPFDLSKFSGRDSGLLRLYSKNEGIKSFFAVPVMSGNVLEGVLSIDSKRAFVFASKDQKLVSLFAGQFANLLNNIRVKRFVDTEASDVAFLHSFCRKIASVADVSSVLQIALDSITQLLRCDSCSISLRTDGEDSKFRVEASSGAQNLKGTTFSDRDGLPGSVIRAKEPFLLNNRKRDLGSDAFVFSKSFDRIKSFLGVPLLTENGVQGLICLIDSDGDSFNQRDLRVVSIMADNASLAVSNAMAQEKSLGLSTIMDGITGLYNFSGFQGRLGIAVDSALEKRRPLSLIITDIDNFRHVNSLQGYEIGNEVLRKLAQVLLDLSKDDSFSAARFGPDEFALILPSIAREQAFLIAEKILGAVEDPTFIPPSYAVDISISAGVSSLPRDGRSCGELVDRALSALSLAKGRGGGVVCCDVKNVRPRPTVGKEVLGESSAADS